ncbi:MAG: hypothetical protein NT019_00620 [Candidatus Adlerbacteria bacterium]|nr:hypothetical protein [Candidatus Adlerbacteria bacterium]
MVRKQSIVPVACSPSNLKTEAQLPVYNRVSTIKKELGVGIFKSKSGGELIVPYDRKLEEVQGRFFSYDQKTVGPTQYDNRGLRIYMVTKVPTTAPGAMEMHEVRREIIFVTRGRVLWTFEDLYGDTHELEIGVVGDDQSGRNCEGVEIPPYVMHTYRALEESDMFIIANASFHEDDLRDMQYFKTLQTRVMAASA